MAAREMKVSAPMQQDVRNRLLRCMPADEFAHLAPHLKAVDLPKSEVLYDHGDPVPYAWFLEDGLGSVIARLPDGEAAEIGLFGYEGLAGTPALLDDPRAEHHLTMQIGGHGYRIDAPVLRAAMRERPKLQTLLLHYIQYFLIQVGQTAVSNARCSIEMRLARWLLMAHDRVDGEDVPLTHEYLSIMLAVRRSSVTVAIHELEGRGFIRGRRGSILMRDRAKLEAYAGDIYGIPEATFQRLIGPLR
jgi:CRP-like cAMP-binding protein